MHIAIVSHDAGGAEVLSSYIRENQLRNLYFYISGPAREIFRRKGLLGAGYNFCPSWSKIDCLLLSMSWSDDYVFRMIRQARKSSIKTEVILDNWYDYARRFGFPCSGWTNNLPDSLIVCDDISERIIKRQKIDQYCFVRKINNPYLNEVLSSYDLIRHKKKDVGGNQDVLFLSSPFSKARKGNLRELLAIKTDERDLLRDILSLCKKNGIGIKLRLHPSEVNSKEMAYGPLAKDITISCGRTSLEEDLFGSKYVIGFCSMALVIAALVGKVAISYKKRDLGDVFLWKRYGVYRRYGIKHYRSLGQIRKILQ